MASWQCLRTETVLRNPWYKISRDAYELPDGSDGEYTYVDIPGSTMTIPLLEDGRFVMVRQFRYLMQRRSLEFPAGGLKEGYEPLEGAQEELREETGYLAKTWRSIGRFAPYNGVSNEYCHVFLASGLEQVGAEPEATEEMEVVEVSAVELRAAIQRRELWDGMTISCLTLYDLEQGAASCS